MNRVSRRLVAAPAFVASAATSIASTCRASARVNPLIRRGAAASGSVPVTSSCNGGAFAADPVGEPEFLSLTLSARMDAAERALMAFSNAPRSLCLTEFPRHVR
jgi:hypothetical protein